MGMQIIYFGAPGTGKSFEISELLEQKNVKSNKIFRVTIHPDFSYSDFVGQILPSVVDGRPSFQFKPGPFTSALAEAYSDLSTEVYLVLEELSRGNIAGIFGDLFQLLDRNDHFESRYPIRNSNIAGEIPTLIGDEIVLPSNFNILCTVNMNDQNVFPMDTAFKRRFDWKYVPATPIVDENGLIISRLNNPQVSIAVDENRNNDIVTTWQSFYCALNSFITDKENGLGRKEDKQIGQFFIAFTKAIIDASHSTDPTICNKAKVTIDEMIRNKLLLYLWQDVQGFGRANGGNTLFKKSINSYGELYIEYGRTGVFSDSFINNYLTPNALKYPYI